MGDSGTEHRKTPRRVVAASVKLRRSGELNYVVDVFDLSERGCKVQYVERPRVGETVWVKFEGLAALEAIVRWTDDSAAGLEFGQPMDPRVLELLINRLR